MSLDHGMESPASAAPVQSGAEVRRHFRRNYLAHSIEGGVFIGALAFLSADTVMPAMIKSLGGPRWLISLSPMAMFMGMMWPPLLTAHWVERLPRVKPFVLFTGVFQRLPFLWAALGLFFWAETHPRLTLALVASAPFLSGTFGGFGAIAWLELVSKAIPPNRRSSASAIRNTIGALMGLSAAGVIHQVLRRHPGTPGYGILFGIAFCFVTLSYLIFLWIREPDVDLGRLRPRRTMAQNLRSLPAILREDVRMRRYVAMRVLGAGIFIMSPYLAIHVLTVLGEPESYLGYLVGCQMAGVITGNFLAGYLGDRYGGKLPVLAARILFVCVCIGAAFNPFEFGFWVLFFFFGSAMTLNMVGNSTLSLEICPVERRPTYLSLLAAVSFSSMLAAAAASTLIREWTEELRPAALLSAGFMAASMLFLIRVREPRSENSPA